MPPSKKLARTTKPAHDARQKQLQVLQTALDYFKELATLVETTTADGQTAVTASQLGSIPKPDFLLALGNDYDTTNLEMTLKELKKRSSIPSTGTKPSSQTASSPRQTVVHRPQSQRMEAAKNGVLISPHNAPYSIPQDKAARWAQFIKKIRRNPGVQAFLHPVNIYIDGCPDYYDIIKSPMDLETVESKLRTNGQGPESHHTPFSDLKLIFNNAQKYNPATHPLHKIAKDFQDQVEEFNARLEDSTLGPVTPTVRPSRTVAPPPKHSPHRLKSHQHHQLLSPTQAHAQELQQQQGQAQAQGQGQAQHQHQPSPTGQKGKQQRAPTGGEKDKLKNDIDMLRQRGLHQELAKIFGKQGADTVNINMDQLSNPRFWAITNQVELLMVDRGLTEGKSKVVITLDDMDEESDNEESGDESLDGIENVGGDGVLRDTGSGDSGEAVDGMEKYGRYDEGGMKYEDTLSPTHSLGRGRGVRVVRGETKTGSEGMETGGEDEYEEDEDSGMLSD